MALEAGGTGVTCNAICPGFVDTPCELALQQLTIQDQFYEDIISAFQYSCSSKNSRKILYLGIGSTQQGDSPGIHQDKIKMIKFRVK